MNPTLATLLTISVTVIAAILVLILIFLIPVLLQVRRTAHEAEKLIDKDPGEGGPMGVRWVVMFAVLVFANLTTVAFAQSSSCPGIHVKVLNIRNSTGTVDCALFDSPVGFPIEALRSAMNVMVMKVRKTEARCDFEDIPAGTYAITVIHDENMDGKLDSNWLGIPKEGYGFSNDVRPLLSAPPFSAASFEYDGGTLDLTISLHY